MSMYYNTGLHPVVAREGHGADLLGGDINKDKHIHQHISMNIYIYIYTHIIIIIIIIYKQYYWRRRSSS